MPLLPGRWKIEPSGRRGGRMGRYGKHQATNFFDNAKTDAKIIFSNEKFQNTECMGGIRECMGGSHTNMTSIKCVLSRYQVVNAD